MLVAGLKFAYVHLGKCHVRALKESHIKKIRPTLPFATTNRKNIWPCLYARILLHMCMTIYDYICHASANIVKRRYIDDYVPFLFK